MRCARGFIGYPRTIVIITSPNRIRCIIATAIELTNNKRFTSILIHIHRDRTIDAATLIVAAEHTSKLTTRDSQLHVTIDGCILSTAEHLIYKVFWHTLQDDVHTTIHLSLLACTVYLTYFQRTSVRILSLHLGTTTHVTLGVTTAIDHMNLTTNQFGNGHTCAIRCVNSVYLIITYVSTRVWNRISRRIHKASAITTAKHLINDITAIDGNLRSRHGSSITTAIDIFDAGRVTAIDNDLGTSLLNIFFIPLIFRV